MYTIDYGTTKETAEALDDAMQTADNNATYNQHDIKITEFGDLVAIRKWSATRDMFGEMENPLDFGDFGYYADWEEA